MPQSYDDDDDDIEPCDHCDCWPDGGDCCDCGMENEDYDGYDDDDDVVAPSVVEPIYDDDGSEEAKDEE